MPVVVEECTEKPLERRLQRSRAITIALAPALSRRSVGWQAFRFGNSPEPFRMPKNVIKGVAKGSEPALTSWEFSWPASTIKAFPFGEREKSIKSFHR